MVWEGTQEVVGEGSLIALGSAVVSRRATMTFEGIKGSPDATVRFEVRDQKPECVEIVLKAKPNGRGIASGDLAQINVDTLTVSVFHDLATIGVRDEAAITASWRDLADARARARRGSVTRAELEDVARIYLEYADSGRPTQAVATLKGYEPRTASRRVKQAEEAGLLPKTTVGKRRA